MAWTADLDNCPPRWSTQPSGRANCLEELRFTAKVMGYPPPYLMPWHEHVLAIASEYDVDDEGYRIPYYREAVVTVPRQCGKSTTILGLTTVHRLLFWPAQPQHTIWGFQKINSGTNFFRKRIWPKIVNSPLHDEFKMRFAKSPANPFLESELNGSSCFIVGQSDEEAHGESLNFIATDEIWTWKDDDREVALLPTLRAVRDPQWLMTSTAGTPDSIFLKDKVDAGRKRADAGIRGGRAYFEWSAPDEDDFEDPAVWRRTIPGFGYSVNEETLRHELDVAGEIGFRRSSLNQWVVSAVEPVIPWDIFKSALVRARREPTSPIVLGVDANPRRDHISFCMSGGGVSEFVDERRSTEGLVDAVERVVKSNGDVVGVAGMRRGPLASELEQLERRGVRMFWFDTPKLAQASSYLFDVFIREEIKVRSARPSLERALSVAERWETSTGAWAWRCRKELSESLASLWALTLSVFAADELQRQGVPRIFTPSQELLDEWGKKSVVDSENDLGGAPLGGANAWRNIHAGGKPESHVGTIS